jgi:hypothetical protein
VRENKLTNRPTDQPRGQKKNESLIGINTGKPDS